MEILPVTPDRLPEALSLCWNVFANTMRLPFPLRESVLFTHTYTRIISALNAKQAVYSSMPHTRSRR